jgi:predicted phosphohydrolase
MALYAISDLHLALNTDKPMDIFGENWYKHDEKIKENWMSKITDGDTVLISGDISWGMKQEDSKDDLEWIHNLPGMKYLIRGNHDYWWSRISKLNKMYDNMRFIQNNFFIYEDWAICGSRGWICPGSDKFNEKDEKIYSREQIRLKLSLDEAKKAGYSKIICMIHYPPTNEKFESSAFTEIFEEYKVSKVVYGHLHGSTLYRLLKGDRNGVEYIMASSDYLNFNPIKILD